MSSKVYRIWVIIEMGLFIVTFCTYLKGKYVVKNLIIELVFMLFTENKF